MTVRIWQAFSCNNSSSYRLIGRFPDAATAKAAADELRAELARLDEPSEDGRSASLQYLAETYGLAWEDEGYGGPEDGPHVALEGELVFVHHRYCLGLGPGVPAFLAERGAQVEPESPLGLHVSVLFAAPRDDARFEAELAALLAQPRDSTSWKQPPLHVPWSELACRGRLACFRDTETVGLYLPVDPSELPALRAWLEGFGVERVALRVEEPGDAALFETLAKARCTACHGPVEYLDPRLHDIETPQVVCRPCGGLYELEAFET